MKILYVGTDAQMCGASFSMVKLIEELDKMNIMVVPVTHSGNTNNILNEKKRMHYIVNAWSWIVSKQYSRIKKHIIKLVKKCLNFPCYIKYKRIINIVDPDLVHINALTTYSAAKAAIKLNKPVVWHIREMIEEDLNSEFWNKNEAYELMKKARCFIAISRCVEDKYKRIVGTDKIRCIYNGVDKALFYKKDHSILEGNSVIISMAGRINKSKGQLDCLKELVPILKANPNVIFQMAGIGSEEDLDQIEQCRIDSGLSKEQVKYLGFVKNIDRLWESTDIAIVYSKCEAFGRVTVEAKMAGTLVVGFNSGGTKELIEDGVDGYLFGNEFDALKNVVEKVLANKEKAREIAQNGRDRVKDVFTSENNAKQIVQLYKDLLL